MPSSPTWPGRQGSSERREPDPDSPGAHTLHSTLSRAVQAARQKGDFAAMATLPSSALDDSEVQVRGRPTARPAFTRPHSHFPSPQASGRFISGSVTANYNQHRREHAADATGRPAQPPGGAHGIGGVAAPIRVGSEPPTGAGGATAAREAAGGGRAAHSSDDRVFQSFRKAEIYRR